MSEHGDVDPSDITKPIDRGLAMRWLSHYHDVVLRTPSVRDNARGAIAAITNLLRGYEPPIHEEQSLPDYKHTNDITHKHHEDPSKI